MKTTTTAVLLLACVAGCSRPPTPAATPYPSGPIPQGASATMAKNVKNMPPELRDRIPVASGEQR